MTSPAEHWFALSRGLLDEVADPRDAVRAVEAVRQEYWDGDISDSRRNEPSRSRLLGYADYIESKIAAIIRCHSILYWLTAERCTGVVPRVVDPVLRTEARLATEAAFQKYGLSVMCDGIGWSDAVEVADILGGLFLERSSAEVVADVARRHLPVLTKFGRAEVNEFLTVHELVFELQRCLARVRLLLWGGRLVPHDLGVIDLRLETEASPLRAETLRLGPATKEEAVLLPGREQLVWLAYYNVLARQDAAEYCGVRCSFARPPQFSWLAFSLRQFYVGHKRMREDFAARTGCQLLAVLTVIACISRYCTTKWASDSNKMIEDCHLAFDRVGCRQQFELELKQLARDVESDGFCGDHLDDGEFEAAINYLSLTDTKRRGLDLCCPTQMFPILPAGHHHIFDHAWTLVSLDRLLTRLSPAGTHCCQ